jgi:O-antigen/teichoic acid export membrane protein
MKNSGRIASAVSIAFGLVPLAICFYEFYFKVPPSDPMEKTLRTYVLLLLLSCSIFFLGLGVLSAFDVVLPYYMTEKGSRQRAKTTFVAALFGIPFAVLMTLMIFSLSSAKTWKFIWAACLGLLVSDFVSATRKLRNKEQ